MATTIQVSEALKRRLLRLKIHPRQPYEEVIAKALDQWEGTPSSKRVATPAKSAENTDKIRSARARTIDRVRERFGLGPAGTK